MVAVLCKKLYNALKYGNMLGFGCLLQTSGWFHLARLAFLHINSSQVETPNRSAVILFGIRQKKKNKVPVQKLQNSHVLVFYYKSVLPQHVRIFSVCVCLHVCVDMTIYVAHLRTLQKC